MCTIVRDGLNVAPIASTTNDTDFRVQRLALQIGEHRVLVRHRHGHSGSAAERRRFNASLLHEHAALTIDVGDFNERPVYYEGGDLVAVFPSEPTFRRNPRGGEWQTTIDGAVFSTALAAAATATALDPIEHSQHRPVLLEAALPPEFHESLRWAVSEPIRMGAWTSTAKGDFAEALASDIDRAWAVWADASGAPEARVLRQASGGGWAAGARAAELHGLWKTLRRQLHDAAYAAADHTLGLITSIIDDANSMRLKEWRQRVGTRGGAAKWVKHRLDTLREAVLPAFGAEVMSPRELARKLSWGLARRWNAGVFQITHLPGLRVDFARVCLDPGLLRERQPPPDRLVRQRFDLSLLPSVPAFSPLGPWCAEHILEFLPDGASGIEGQSVAWLEHLHKDSLDRLALLLTAADAGRLPGFWAQARVTLIPKGPDSPPGDRRPLTVLPVTYRLWTRRHTVHLTQWILAWKPPGLAGAVPRHSCPDVLWELQAKLAEARVAQTDPAYVLSLDLEKCYDRLDLHNLLELTNHLGLDICGHVLRNYQNLSRILFVDNQPTDVVIQGANLVGVPQGCPMACFLCNLTSIMWHLAVERAVPTATLFSYLDDRFILARSWQDLAAALAATRAIDLAIGPDMNLPKCARGLSRPLARAPQSAKPRS